MYHVVSSSCNEDNDKNDKKGENNCLTFAQYFYNDYLWKKKKSIDGNSHNEIRKL